jgi:hypothetical protein
MSNVSLSTEEVSTRIVTGMGAMYDLYNELDLFLSLIRTSVDAESLMKRNFKLPLGPRKSRTAANRYLAVDLGVVFDLNTAASDDEAEIDDEGESEIETKGLQITADSQFLAIRVLLYDPEAAKGSFVPRVFAAILDNVVKVPIAKRKAAGGAKPDFKVQRNQFLHLVKKLAGGIAPGQKISSRVTGGEISTMVSKFWSKPLAEFQSEKDVQEFLDPIKEYIGG